MKSFSYTITDMLGMHARPAAELVKLAKTLACDITIEREGEVADAKKLFALMGLAIKNNHTVTIMATGENEEEEIQILEDFFKENL
ncbi:MAG: HPr family phosphocarrier protein [Defluviitaleaceae bacterium]|nr:HPr family phosphocarrier protein [Defluviitaleaceae bacterium]